MQKHKIKLLLWKHNPNKQGHLPIYLKITVNSKTNYISTGYYINRNLWDEKGERVKSGHPLAATINQDITHKKSEISIKAVDAQIKGTAISSSRLKNDVSHSEENIFDFIDKMTKDLKNKREEGTLENYANHSLKLERFHGSRQLSFDHITPDFLTLYEDYLKKEGYSINYIWHIFNLLKTFFKAAIKKRVTEYYPFDDFESPQYKATSKDYLSLTELEQWERYAGEEPSGFLRETAVYFLLGCYSGLRVSDWKKFNPKKDIINSRLVLQAKKNKEWLSVPVSSPLKRVIALVEKTPLRIKWTPTLNENLKRIAKALKIEKRISTHCARKTFAITMCVERGISSETCAVLMGITHEVCVKNYYETTPVKIEREVIAAWSDLT